MRRRPEVSRTRLRQAVRGADLAPGGAGLGQMVERAMSIRCSVSVGLAFFGVRLASEVAGLRVSDVRVDEANSAVELKVRRQKNDELGVGQMARVVALPSWGGARPVHRVSEWLWFRSWLTWNRNYAGRMPASADGGPPFAGLARARFGLGLASSGVAASRRNGLNG